jgi:hypothetical protein
LPGWHSPGALSSNNQEVNMTLMDDFRKKTEEGIKTLKETAEGIAFNVEKQARIARKKMDIMKVQKKIQKNYAEVGEYVYGEYAMERSIMLETPFLKDRMIAISQLKADIRYIEDEIEEIRRMQQPGREEQAGAEEAKEEDAEKKP